jgi:hypothetical protein
MNQHVLVELFNITFYQSMFNCLRFVICEEEEREIFRSTKRLFYLYFILSSTLAYRLKE